MNAQRCAVMEFRAGAGISQSDVDGISAIFITYFRPEGYTMVERTQIDRVIDEQGFQRSHLTESQMVRIGEILNVSKIVVGDVNIVMGQYNVDVRAINVETGTQAGWAGDSFSASSYRTTMQNIAQELANQIAIKTVSTSKVSGVYADLGLPSGTLWKKINETGNYSYEKAINQYGNNLPTKEQIEELLAVCQIEWPNGGGCKLTGPSGEFITLPNVIPQDCNGNLGFGIGCFYWSSTYSDDPEKAAAIYFLAKSSSGVIQIWDLWKCMNISVRLVQNP